MVKSAVTTADSIDVVDTIISVSKALAVSLVFANIGAEGTAAGTVANGTLLSTAVLGIGLTILVAIACSVLTSSSSFASASALETANTETALETANTETSNACNTADTSDTADTK